MSDIEFTARNIVNQIADCYSERIPSDQWVAVRQATNEELDKWVTGMIESALASERTAREAAEAALSRIALSINGWRTGGATMRVRRDAIREILATADLSALTRHDAEVRRTAADFLASRGFHDSATLLANWDGKEATE